MGKYGRRRILRKSNKTNECMDEGEKWIPTKKETYDIYCKKNQSLYSKCMNSPGSSTISIQPSSGGEINFGMTVYQ